MSDTRPGRSLAEQLERGEVVQYPLCPFATPEGADRTFFLEQQLGSRAHKNIGFDPQTGKTTGFLRRSPEQAARLRDLFTAFSRSATAWLSTVLPRYAGGWQLDRASFRPVEESTRKLRLTARNDLLHVDAFPGRPSNGWRILRLFVNLNPSESRVWITADTFPTLLERYGEQVGLPADDGEALLDRLRDGILRIFQPGKQRRSAYDSFMLRLHNFLKANADYQKNCCKRTWEFAPGSAWLALTDTVTHAALRGRYALEHSYFISPRTLALPALSPPALLERMCKRHLLRLAA
jgi:hypothetical protein